MSEIAKTLERNAETLQKEIEEGVDPTELLRELTKDFALSSDKIRKFMILLERRAY